LKDLVVLAADGRMRASLQEILARHESLGARPFSYDVFSHPEHDPGVLLRGHLLLQPLRNDYAYAIVVFDRDGCGSPQPVAELSATVQENMDGAGWAGRCAVTVLDPELEVWVWADSPHVAKALGWKRAEMLSRWLKDKGLVREGEMKPMNPKEAMEAALYAVRLPMSTSIYRRIARNVGLARCGDHAFVNFQATLRGWFPR
jgi:hypothetical protein